MSKNHELMNILNTLQIYAECDITQSFSKSDSEILVYYCKETESFMIIHNNENKESYDDIDTAFTILQNLLQTN
jgi:hypothetical protein